MEWFTLGNMITRIRIGQKASTPGFSRTVIRRPDGLFWVGGIWAGQVVQLRDFLFQIYGRFMRMRKRSSG
ncbi:hypothetical protein N6H13_10800 [Paenibacillus sp. CC-CFT742]|nr:hypothetical protein [Paenibacillus sp. CC-CFT742]WJH31013.1 hypothetical protein N6H13_10800 [Paenibacillus sp. CC-CFT742]